MSGDIEYVQIQVDIRDIHRSVTLMLLYKVKPSALKLHVEISCIWMGKHNR